VHASAKPAQCFLSIDGKTYIDKVCNGEFEKDGSFTLGAGETAHDRYFVYANENDDGTMAGYWNGTEAESHAHEDLGTLSQSGACWANDHARVCAWKIGEKRNLEPSSKHPEIYKSAHCAAQWVNLPGSRVWFTGFIKNTGPEGAAGPMFKTGDRLTWWGDHSFSLAADALLNL
jgi:hypothetical protein